jgi:hypothetical protein
MDHRSLAAASRNNNMATNATAAPARRKNIWDGDADVDQPSDGQSLRRKFFYDDDNQAMMTLLTDHQIEYTTKAELVQHVRTVIIPKLFERKMVIYQPGSKRFRQCDEKSAIARVVSLMQGLPDNKHVPGAPITAVSKLKLPILPWRRKNDDSNHRQKKKQKLARTSNIAVKISEETNHGAKNEQPERTGKDSEPGSEEVGAAVTAPPSPPPPPPPPPPPQPSIVIASGLAAALQQQQQQQQQHASSPAIAPRRLTRAASGAILSSNTAATGSSSAATTPSSSQALGSTTPTLGGSNPFPSKLMDLLGSEDSSVVSWLPSGDALLPPEPALAEETGRIGNSESKGASGDEIPLLLLLLNMDRSDEEYERLVELVNAMKIHFHDYAFYPSTYEYEIHSRTDSIVSHDLFGVADPIFDKIRACQAITVFLNAHCDSMVESTDVKDYVSSRIVPVLIDANVCRYDGEANEFVSLSFEDVAEIVITLVNQLRQQLVLPTVDTAYAPPDNNAFITDNAPATTKHAPAAPVQQPVVAKAEERRIVFDMAPTVCPGRIATSKAWTPAAPGGVLPTRINLETDPSREEMTRQLSLRFDIPFHHCAFYPGKWHSKKCVFLLFSYTTTIHSH